MSFRDWFLKHVAGDAAKLERLPKDHPLDVQEEEQQEQTRAIYLALYKWICDLFKSAR